MRGSWKIAPDEEQSESTETNPEITGDKTGNQGHQAIINSIRDVQEDIQIASKQPER